MDRPIPLIILGGSDRRGSELPPEGADKHALSGYKGAEMRVEGRPLVEIVAERMTAGGVLGPVRVAGPAEVYRRAGVKLGVIDTDDSFGGNIQAAIEATRTEFPDSPVAITTADLLPKVEDVQTMVDDYLAAAPLAFWGAFIRTPENRDELGASAWKPRYRMVERKGEEPAPILPGHLAIVLPQALKLRFLYDLVDLTYRSRNKPIAYRRSYIVRGLIWGMLLQDLRHLATLRLPNVTWNMLRTGLAAAKGLKDGDILLSDLERAIERIFVRTQHRRRHPNSVRLPILEGLSLAEDIDTAEEAAEKGAQAGGAVSDTEGQAGDQSSL